MRVVVFGANGSTGTEVVRHCRSKGYDPVAAVRRPESANGLGVEIAKIDLEDRHTLVDAMRGADAIVSCLGHGGLSASSKPTTLYSNSVRAYRSAMREAGVDRIIVLSSGGTVHDEAAPWYYSRLLRKQLINTYLDMARMETILEESDDLRWTIVRLTYLIEGRSQKYVVRDREIGGGTFKIHFTDAGRFISDELDRQEWIRRHPVIGYP